VHHNRLVVAFESDAGNDLWTSEANLHSVNFLCAPLSGCRKLSAKTRYRDASVPVTVTFGHSGTAHVAFVRPERALAAGQTLAFYRGSRLLGGGIYESMPREPQWREPQ
jgi:tRNA-specific 2-thiouridylase